MSLIDYSTDRYGSARFATESEIKQLLKKKEVLS